MKNLAYWLIDYIYLLRGQSHALIYLKPPKHYLGLIDNSKYPIVIIPGLLEPWCMMTKVADKLSLLEHPVYILPQLGYNTKDIPRSAEIVLKLIHEKNLKDVIIVSHSKGGIIGKFILAHLNKDKNVKKLIAIATPFSGTALINRFPIKHYKELTTSAKIIADLQSHTEVNKNIVSIYPSFDNHIWPQKGSVLKGATNIEVPVCGHHKILFSREALDKVIENLN